MGSEGCASSGMLEGGPWSVMPGPVDFCGARALNPNFNPCPIPSYPPCPGLCAAAWGISPAPAMYLGIPTLTHANHSCLSTYLCYARKCFRADLQPPHPCLCHLCRLCRWPTWRMSTQTTCSQPIIMR